MKVKERMKEVIASQPDDASYEEILRELAFEHMIRTRSDGCKPRACNR